MQAWLLYIIYGAYASEAGQFQTAKKMLRQLVDVSIVFCIFLLLPYLGLSFDIGCTRNRSVPTGYRYARCPVLDVPTRSQFTWR
jgi:hypothetical protein